MTAKDKHDSSTLTLVEAVETLSSIADMDMRHEKKINDKAIQWVQGRDAQETITLVKDIFKVILNHLRKFYSKQSNKTQDSQKFEGIKTLMVLVGEAAKKLDRFTTLFQKTKLKSVTDLREYKQLQEFYISRIARKIDEGTLGRWLLALTRQAWMQKPRLKLDVPESLQTKHVFIDLDAVKRDSEYELLLLRKEDGSRFFSPRLIRNIKLVCDFGDYFISQKKLIDPLEDIIFWRDKSFHIAAKGILKSLGNRLDRFYREALKFKDRELVENLNKAILALLLAANIRNHLCNEQQKSCLDYFADFEHYLRAALSCGDYHKLIAYPAKQSNKLAHLLLDVAHGLCIGLFSTENYFHEWLLHIKKFISEANTEQSGEHEKAAKDSHLLWNRLASDNSAILKSIKHHPNGPLNKVLEILQEGSRLSFDPFMQNNTPTVLYDICMRDTKIMQMRLPCPTTQEFINKATVIDEFKGFLRGCSKDQLIQKMLVFNLQDRTSWREHSRCLALEEIQSIEEFEKHLKVVTLAKDTEFYHQMPPYQKDNHADVFMEHFQNHLKDRNSGFYFPESLHKQLFPHFVGGVMDAVHRIFFSGKNILLKDHRLNFIEIFYMFLQLKLIEIVKPDAFSFTCKDSIDVGSSSSAQLYAFLKLLAPEKLSEADKDEINGIFHSAPIMLRERALLPERFNRALNAIKTIELVREQHGEHNFALIIHEAFGQFFKTPILHAKLRPHRG